jgi:hypothetical protein
VYKFWYFNFNEVFSIFISFCNKEKKITNWNIHHIPINNQLTVVKYTMVDPRRVIGSIVTAKACHVMSMVECARRYGSNKSTKVLEGVIVEVVVVRNVGNNRTTTNITADYSLTDCVKRATLNIRCVTAKRVEVTEEEEGAMISEASMTQNNAVGDNAFLVDRTVVLTGLEDALRTPPTLACQSEASTSSESPSNTIDTLFPVETNTNNHATTTTPRSVEATNITFTAHGQNWYTDDTTDCFLFVLGELELLLEIFLVLEVMPVKGCQDLTSLC